MSPAIAPDSPLSTREKVAYSFGDLGSCLFWNSFMTNLLMFYTDVFGISAAAASLLFLFSRIFDAANDPIIGILADRTRTRWGRYRPYLLWFSLPLCLAGIMLFTTPDFAMTGKLAWAWITYNLVMVCYTLVNIPYTALLGAISPHSRERGSVATYKFAGAFTGGIIVSFTFMPMTKYFGEGDAARGWQYAFGIVCLTALPFFLLCFAGTRERVLPIVAGHNSIRQDLKDLLRNRAWWVLTGITMGFVFFCAVRYTVTNHYLKYYVGAQSVRIPFLGERRWDFETLQAVFNSTGQIASVIGVLLIGTFVAKVDKRWNFLAWFTLSVLSTAMPFWLGPSQAELIIVSNIIANMTCAPLCVLIWAMYSDAAEYSEWRNHRQATGLVFSASTFMQKLGWGLGPAGAAWMLDRFGFAPNVSQGEDVLSLLVLLVSLVPACFGILSMAMIAFYPLSEAKLENMGAELRARRAAATVPAEAALTNG